MNRQQEETQIKEIRSEIFQLALKSPDTETMHWYMWLDECFENDEFHHDELSTIKWRCMVLSWKKEPVTPLSWKIDALVKQAGYDLNEVKTGLE
ncbi:hypothetical protein LCGC14_1423250 [marine sediment metagenome]|uniref:Uncharacterized protein n=1 Tax=marine sediment metagenome TaxID=412755 RepID=A0A0F9JQK0_9ZZZZ